MPGALTIQFRLYPFDQMRRAEKCRDFGPTIARKKYGLDREHGKQF